VKVYTAKSGFVLPANDKRAKRVVAAGQVVKDSDPDFKFLEKSGLVELVKDDDAPVESATAKPGVKRQTKPRTKKVEDESVKE
jgi:hypothetical protein